MKRKLLSFALTNRYILPLYMCSFDQDLWNESSPNVIQCS